MYVGRPECEYLNPFTECVVYSNMSVVLCVVMIKTLVSDDEEEDHEDESFNDEIDGQGIA